MIRKQGWFWVLLGGLGLAAVWQMAFRPGGGGGEAVAMPGWVHGLDEASAGPALVLFTADWCGPCQSLKKDVLTTPEVESALNGKVQLVKIDLTDPKGADQAVAEAYGVQGIPTLVLLSAERKEVARKVGNMPKAEFLGWLNRSLPRGG